MLVHLHDIMRGISRKTLPFSFYIYTHYCHLLLKNRALSECDQTHRKLGLRLINQKQKALD